MSQEFLGGEHLEELKSDLKVQPSLRSTKEKNTSRSAVLVPICRIWENNQDDPLESWGLMYTKRSAFLSSHAREICFPGGKCDSPEESFESAALRETFEELGIESSNIKILSEMSSITNKKGGSLITPVVGMIQNPAVMSNLRINASEVDEVFVKSFRDLQNPSVTGYTQFRAKGSQGYSLPVYRCEPYTIWGMTAIITFQLLTVVLKGRGYKHKLLFQTPFKRS